MKLKSKRPTDGLTQVEFGELKLDYERPQESVDSRPNRVLTPDHGWQPVLDFQKIKSGPTVIIKSDTGSLQCDPKHRLRLAAGEWKFAGDLNPAEDLLQTIDGVLDYTVDPGPTADLYDIEIPAPHAYYTGGFVSHNSIMLCNNAIYQTQVGVDTLLVTFELDMIKTAARCLGALSKVALNTFHDHRIMVTDAARRTFSTNNAHLVIAELPPDECSVDDIYGIISRLRKTKGWSPKCVVIDYLELMVGRRAHENKEDYSRQKAVANQVRGLAKNEDVLVFTATQTNRAGNDQDKLIGLTNVAESYGKTMPLDYIISLNQNDDERKAGKLKMFINKNRNGPKHEVIECSIDYKTMHLGQAVF